MTPRMDALKIPEGSARYFSIDLDEWRGVQLDGAAAELAKLDEEIPPLKAEMEEDPPKPTPAEDSLEEVAWALSTAGLFRKEHRHARLTAMVSALADLPKRGLHHFKFPGYSKAHAWVRWSATAPHYSLSYGALIGMFWANRGMELDAKLSARATDGQLDEFAEAVLEDLQDTGYSWQEIRELAKECDKRLGGWIAGLTEAKKVADFTSPKED